MGNLREGRRGRVSHQVALISLTIKNDRGEKIVLYGDGFKARIHRDTTRVIPMLVRRGMEDVLHIGLSRTQLRRLGLIKGPRK